MIMKKIYISLLSVAAILLFAPTVCGQYTHTYDMGGDNTLTLTFPKENHDNYGTNPGVGVSKNISSPVNGQYWIKLEAFAKGEAIKTISDEPADIVLVLDFSSSMNYYYGPSGYHYNLVTASNGFAYSNTFWTATATTGQRFYKVGEQYLQVQRGQEDSGETFVTPQGVTVTKYYQYLYIVVNGTTYYLDDMSLVTTMPHKYTNEDNNAAIWNGALYEYRNFNNTQDALQDNTNRYTRLRALRGAVADFIEIIYHNDNYEDEGFDNRRTTPLGNRISIVTFNSNNANLQPLVGWTGVTNDDRSKDETLIKAITNAATANGTFSNRGMKVANDLLAIVEGEEDRESSRTVVLFTDGAPGNTTSWSTNASGTTANNCITEARTAKINHSATVFSVLVLENDPVADMRRYLEGVSSNYPLATAYNNLGVICTSEDCPENLRKETADFYKNAGDDLSGVFQEIASQSGGSSNTSLSESTSTIDVVSSSFQLSGSHSVDDIKIYTAPYLFDEENEVLYFGDEVLAPCSGGLGPNVGDRYDKYEIQMIDGKEVKVLVEGSPFDVDDDIEIDSDQLLENIVEVTGFDYSNNWCGPVKDGEEIIGAQGHKLIILIPIEMAENAVGGPNVETNAPGSGIYADPDDEEPVVPFVSPDVSLPVNISVKKMNLQNGESAKFMIERTTLPITSTSVWTYVTSIFVTKSDANTDPIVNIKGLPSTSGVNQDYVYRIVEEDWSWTYEFNGATGKGIVEQIVDGKTTKVIQDITVNDKNKVTTDKFVTNPIIFNNRLKDENVNRNVRHAESKATNTFIPKSATESTSGVVRYNDTKDRNKNN